LLSISQPTSRPAVATIENCVNERCADLLLDASDYDLHVRLWIVSPTSAARYQIIIMYLPSCSTFMCTISFSILTVIAGIDGDHRVRSDRTAKQRTTSFSLQSIRDIFSARSRLFAFFRYRPIQENAITLDRGADQVASYGAVSEPPAHKETSGSHHSQEAT
jgi:hypothetical protein